jgi:hypothetical protein
MKRAAVSLLFFCAALPCGACGGATPAPASSSTGVAAKQPTDDPNRALTKSECDSLGQWLAESCANRPNERSARVDGWCSDIMRGVAEGTWGPGDCAKNVKYMDSVCFESAPNVHNMMACDESVHRP